MKALSIGIALLWAVSCYGQTWLSLPAATGYVDIGDLDVPGNQLTVEALYTSTNAASVDLVSKHSGPPNVNYLLRRTHAELSTTSGFSFTPQICPPDENTCRHAAMVYDGVNLRFYLNGQLNGQVPFTGTMIQNNFQTLIGNLGCCFSGEQFFGFIDEVRIWNVARTQVQVQTFMFAPLPTPTTQIGLQAYYSFNSLTNLQGNPAWNGTIAGTASIGSANPICSALTSVCVILGGKFERFTAGTQAGGLQLDWKWAGEAPQYFLLEGGSEPASLSPLQQIDGSESTVWIANAPHVPTWLRVAALSRNGERTESNSVLFMPSAQTNGLRLEPAAGHVNVIVPQPMHLQWRIVDAAGRLHAAGQIDAVGDVQIPLPHLTSTMLIVQVTALGQTKVIKCIVE